MKPNRTERRPNDSDARRCELGGRFDAFVFGPSATVGEGRRLSHSALLLPSLQMRKA